MQYPKILHIHNLIVAVLVTSVGATAQAASLSSQFYLPETSFIAALPEIQSMPDLSSIRVHVFPHLLTYSTPQGAEKIVDRITLTSKGSCLEQIGNHAFNKIPSPMHFTFAGLTEVKEPIKIQCTLPITVEREAGLESFSYRGGMIVKISNDPVPGTLEVLNVISLEDYLKGVVPSEMPTTWSEEILKVQAVAARTYAAYEIEAERELPTHPSYDIDDTVFYQAYLGVSKESTSATQAVTETNHQILTFNGKLIKAYFSADAGGATEDAGEVFPDGHEYCLGKKEPFEPSLIPGDAWTKSVPLSVLNEVMQREKIIPLNAKIAILKIHAFDASQRVKSFDVKTDQGETILVAGPKFRLLFHLRSLMLTQLQESGSFYEFSGRGIGHGVGMSQWGSRILVDRLGYSYSQVLRFYYSNILLTDLH